MTVRINKEAINLREKLSELDKPSGLTGEELLRADTSADARGALDLEEHLFEDFESTGIDDNATSTKVTVSDSGVDVDGDLSFGDNDKATFGASDDLQIYHDGSTNRVVGSVDVTGTVTADGLTVDGTTSLDNTSVQQLNISGLTKITGTRGTFVDPSEDPSVPNIFATNDAVGDFSQEAGHLVIQSRVHPTVYRDVIFAGGAGTAKRLMTLFGEGDVHLYEDTGTTAKFVWDSSAESLSVPKLNITSGNITTTATAGDHTVFNSTGADADFRVRTGANTHSLYIEGNTGNVGIGTDSPSLPLDVHGGTIGVTSTSAFSGLQINSANTSFGYINFGDPEDDNIGQIYYNHPSNSLSFKTNTVERARIDSSGNLLVGTTDPAVIGNNTKGFVVQGSTGTIFATGDNLYAQILNRKGNDGEILQFRKDGSTVGSIGVYSANEIDVAAEGSSTSAGIRLSSQSAILPKLNNTLDNGNISLGNSTRRFKDLYLSGGVYLGGTGAANKLDDYETGTWTPTGYTGGTVLSPTYTKVGNLVTLSVYFYNGTFDGSTIGGLPFAVTTNKFEAVSLANYDATNVNNAFASSQTVINFKNGSSDVTPNASKMMLKVTYQTSA